ncbi:alpha-1,2-fucosyltransferase [Silicimonas algicola]|nr:alpha-1,2-fucosyltransferase [Silicimonas algicola]AZQ66755.1 alpha-1,2-fucosyltransferase [Silicimonas algicola]
MTASATSAYRTMPSLKQIKLIAAGGLGNQLFQYAAARSIALRADAELAIDTRHYASQAQDGPMRFCIDTYPIQARIVGYPAGLWGPNSIVRRVTRRLITERPGRKYVEPRLGFCDSALSIRNSMIISGWFHSEKYFVEHADLIRKELDLGMLASRQVEGNRTELDGMISVHVRRGDYLSLKEFQMKDPHAYYSRAMRYMKSQFPDARFVIFSDDVTWCRKQPLFERCEFFESLLPSDHRYDLYAMSQCSHHIVANSSFSWWGAWWNWRPDKIVIAPEYWFGEKSSRDFDIVPDHWIVM